MGRIKGINKTAVVAFIISHPDLSYEEVARVFDISRARVSQIVKGWQICEIRRVSRRLRLVGKGRYGA